MKTILELLQKIKDEGIKEIEPYLNIGHSPTIGDMYEGLMSKVLNTVIEPLNKLKVIKGKIRNEDGKYSKQLDCMIVEGPAEKLPNTEFYIAKPEQVLS